MKSFSSIKKALNEGVFLTMVQHDLMPSIKLLGLKRKIVKRQSNAIQLEGGSWLRFDKPASHFQGTSANSFKVLLNAGNIEPKYMAYVITLN